MTTSSTRMVGNDELLRLIRGYTEQNPKNPIGDLLKELWLRRILEETPKVGDAVHPN